MAPKQQHSKQELFHRLSFEQYRVTQFGRTEQPFADDCHRSTGEGHYHCVVCDVPLFSSAAKFNSGTGWPSFWEPIAEGAISNSAEPRSGARCANSCASCGAHLGHLFDDLKTATQLRYCMNSASLRFVASTTKP